MRRRRAVVAALMLVLTGTGCDGPDAPSDLDPATEVDAPPPALVTDAAVPIDGHVLVMTWADDATLAARNGPTVLLRFASASRHPGLDADPDCVPTFAGVLRDDAEALADASVTRQGAATYSVRGVGLRVDVVVEDGRVGHLDGCGGPASLRAEAEQEERARMAAEQAARESAERDAAEREAAELASEQATRQPAADDGSGTGTDDGSGTETDDGSGTETDDGSGTDESEIPTDDTVDEPVDDRVEVFPRDRTPASSG